MPKMENYQGDLTDVVRAISQPGNGGTGSSSKDQPKYNNIADYWQFPSLNIPLYFSSSLEEEPNSNFGDPFSNTKDPLLNELEMPVSGFFTNSSEMVNSSHVDDSVGQGLIITDSCSASNLLPKSSTVVDDHDIMKKPCNIFSKMLQISPSTTLPAASSGSCDSPTSPTGIKPPIMAPNDRINVNSSKGCMVDNTGVQISPPRNPGVKRRKSQAKKVVCIPAPAPAKANSRPGGEVVPSDLWAWRKYGQKPIKGSPYPRGYYRCSSSKGCSARKQVERSRTDPNMLVITYTSEHNHPWPTQRNALAGSTRSQPTKSSNASSKSSTTTKITSSPKQEQIDYNNNACLIFKAGAVGSTSTSMRDEIGGIEKQAQEFAEDSELIISSETAPLPYKPSMLDQSNQSHDQQEMFSGLGEIEADPLNLLFTQDFPTDDQQKGNNSQALEPFINIFDDWSGDNNTNSFDEKTNYKGLL